VQCTESLHVVQHCSHAVHVCRYRRHGHNELDQPSFTQPKMYEKIRPHPSALAIYKQKLIDEGVLTKAEVDAVQVWLGCGCAVVAQVRLLNSCAAVCGYAFCTVGQRDEGVWGCF
jgi:hypothetical protein